MLLPLEFRKASGALAFAASYRKGTSRTFTLTVAPTFGAIDFRFVQARALTT